MRHFLTDFIEAFVQVDGIVVTVEDFNGNFPPLKGLKKVVFKKNSIDLFFDIGQEDFSVWGIEDLESDLRMTKYLEDMFKVDWEEEKE